MFNSDYPLSKFPFKRYALYVLAVSALFWLPILAMPSTTFSQQLVGALLLYGVLILQPLLRLRFWVSIAIAAPLMALFLMGSSYLAYELLGFGSVDFSGVWAYAGVLYLMVGGITLQFFLLSRKAYRAVATD